MRDTIDVMSETFGPRLRPSAAAAALFVLGAGVVLVWFLGSSNPFTPAGYVGYLTKGAVLGHSRFYGVQKGPTSAGRTWLLDVTNVSVTPYTYTEAFGSDDAVLSRDNLKIAFAVHMVWRVDDTKIPLFMEKYSTTASHDVTDKSPDSVVQVAYRNFVREPLRTFARDEVQRRNGLEVKDALISIGDACSPASVRMRLEAHSSSAVWWSATCSIRRKWPMRSRASSQPHKSSSGRTPRSRSNGRNARNEKCRRKASPMPWRSFAAS
jgi:hypothetical protein